MENTFAKHPLFGILHIIPKRQARRIIVRAAANGLDITVPAHLQDMNEVNRLLDNNRERILEMQRSFKDHTQTIDNRFCISTDILNLTVGLGAPPNTRTIQRKKGQCIITYPNDYNFEHFQEDVKMTIREELRIQAKLYLYDRIEMLAEKWGFQFCDVKIQSSRTRWGSCSSKNNINFSLYLMCVPSHLIDYVILHELCHTVHHDHSPRFWAEMDRVTGQKAQSLRHELSQYKIPL